ncbi:MAG: response regulator, partial [Peptostreptococcaceae bacterium]|nr:response regulator [Peptostreptococcaceae bacterium]
DYDVIFMDIKMPVMDGLTAAEEIRKFDKETPIIALSANAYKEDVEKSIEAGMNAHLSKPFNKKIIFDELSKQLKNK